MITRNHKLDQEFAKLIGLCPYCKETLTTLYNTRFSPRIIFKYCMKDGFFSLPILKEKSNENT